ncbi:MAG: hypothetical protein RLZZ147_993 [Actinomycetota bacterium]
MVIFSMVIAPIWVLQESLPGGNLLRLCLVVSISVVLYLGLSKLFKISEVISLLKVIRPGR